jgi:hypothetical protein
MIADPHFFSHTVTTEMIGWINNELLHLAPATLMLIINNDSSLSGDNTLILWKRKEVRVLKSKRA